MKRLAINGGPKAAEAAVIPTWPILDEGDKRRVNDVLDSRKWGRLEGGVVAEFEQAFAAFQGVKHGLAVSNGTVAIELALLSAGVRPGDEVLVPAVTFIASATAIVRVGAVPIFVDSDPETAVVSPSALERAITERTTACVLVHYGGYPCDMDAILPIAAKHGIAVVEDCAHAQGTQWRGKGVGGLGAIGTFSFQSTKSLTLGEGGIVVTDDETVAQRARLVHNIGRQIGQPGYVHYVVGSNYRLGELSAALGLGQLDRLPEQIERRAAAAEFLATELGKVGGLAAPKPDPRITRRGYYFFVLRYDASQFGGIPRNRFLQALQAEGVPCGLAYGMPLYRQPAFSRANIEPMYARGAALPDYQAMYLPVAERFCAEEQIVFPHAVLLADRSTLGPVVEAVAKVKEYADELLDQRAE